MNEWISVKDKLPEMVSSAPCDEGHYENSSPVLVCDIDGDVYVAVYGIDYDDEHVSRVKYWLLYPISGDELDVTHWMPLPEPPKEVRNNDEQ